MGIDTRKVNPAFQSILRDPNQTIFLDANFFIPPDRSSYKGVKAYTFERFKVSWLEPLFKEFSRLSIHESVYDELVADKVREYADAQRESDSKHLEVYYDAELNEDETALMNYYITKIAVYSQYDPYRDNAKDRGEVRTLAFMAVKQYPCFAANDALAVRLINDAVKLDTGLQPVPTPGGAQLVVQQYALRRRGVPVAFFINFYKNNVHPCFRNCSIFSFKTASGS